MGGKRVVFHPATQGKADRETAVALAEDRLKILRDYIYLNNMQDMLFCPETMGKLAQIGTVEEIVRFCKIDPVYVPCVDFGHINAREQGSLKTVQDYKERLEYLIAELGYERMKNFHVHFSKIMYSAKGEVKHLTFEDDVIGEKPSGFAAVSVKSNGGSATVVEKNGTNMVQVVSKAGLGDSIELDCNDVTKESKGFVFTGKFSVKSVTSTGTKAGAFLRLEFFGDKHVYRIVFNKTASGIEVHDASSNNTGSVAKTTHIATLDYDEWLDLKIEYTKGDKNTITFKIYVGGNLIAESHNYFDEYANLETPYTDVKKVRFFNWINADCVWYMDDLYFYAVNE
jgi:hypothetical protein